MIRLHPHCHAGPDYDTLAAADRTDKIHLSATGARQAARLWAEALGRDFFQTARPLSPRLPAAP
jgi:hypothetical protein